MKEQEKNKRGTAPMSPNIRFHQRTLKWINNSNGEEGSLSVINVHLRMIDDVLTTYVHMHPLYKIRNQFEEMKKKYLDKIKKLEEQISAVRSSGIHAPGSADGINTTV
jgi:hypothetical protein